MSVLYFGLLLCFFFFQAEDGIRDYKVTGVQTCALPILSWDALFGAPVAVTPTGAGIAVAALNEAIGEIGVTEVPPGSNGGPRSEERRVGKEGGSRLGGGPLRAER